MSCRILVFSEYWHPHGGGAELATFLYVRELARLGHRLTVLTHQELSPSVCGIDGVEYLRVPDGHTSLSRYDALIDWPATKEWLLRRLPRADLIYVPGNWVAAIALGRRYGIPTVAHLHNYAVVCPASILYNPLSEAIGPCSGVAFLEHERRMRGPVVAPVSALLAHSIGTLTMKILRLADRLICVSEAQRRLISRFAPELSPKLRLVPNPVPPVKHAPIQSRGVGYFGGRPYYKGPDVLRQALRLLRGPEGIRIVMASDVKAARTRPIGGHLVRELPRLTPHSLEAEFSRISVVAAPSICPEPLPYLPIESVLRGRIVVTTSIGGMEELRQLAPHAIWTAEPQNASQLASHLANALALELDEVTERTLRDRPNLTRLFDPHVAAGRLLTVAWGENDQEG